MRSVGAKGSCRTAEPYGEARAGAREGYKFSRRLSPLVNATCSAERRSGSALVVRLALVVCYAPVALGSSASEENAPASSWVLFWTSWGHLSAAFVEVIRGRLPLHRADRQLRMQ